jgi:hypothetical protein
MSFMAQRTNIIVFFCMVVWSAIAGGLRSPAFVASLNAPVTQSTNEPSSLLNGLVSYWSFDSASLTNDLHGTNHLTAVCSSIDVLYNASGKIGSAAIFTNNVANYFSIARARADQLAMVGSNKFSLSVWMKYTVHAATCGVIGFIGPSTTSCGWDMYVQNALLGCIASTNGNYISNSVFRTGIISNIWLNVVFVSSDTDQIVYTNGVVAASETLTTLGLSNPSAAFNIGCYGGATARTFYGLIDEPAVWNRALTTNEIQTLYNSGAGKQYPFN